MASAWVNYDFKMQLTQEMLKLMADEGEWILARGSIEGESPTAEAVAPYIGGSFLAEIDVSRVTLD